MGRIIGCNVQNYFGSRLVRLNKTCAHLTQATKLEVRQAFAVNTFK